MERVTEAPAAGKSAEDAERSLIFKYQESVGKETRRELLFVSRRQRDGFIDEVRPSADSEATAALPCGVHPPSHSFLIRPQVERINPRLVIRRRDGTLTSTGDKAKRMADMKRFAEGEAGACLPARLVHPLLRPHVLRNVAMRHP